MYLTGAIYGSLFLFSTYSLEVKNIIKIIRKKSIFARLFVQAFGEVKTLTINIFCIFQ